MVCQCRPPRCWKFQAGRQGLVDHPMEHWEMCLCAVEIDLHVSGGSEWEERLKWFEGGEDESEESQVARRELRRWEEG